jgi:hypothetical protein
MGETAMNYQDLEPKSRGEKLNNPGNIAKNGKTWPGEVHSEDTRFKAFINPEGGILELAKLLLEYRRDHGLDTIRTMITKWAPPKENDTWAYIEAVSKMLHLNCDLHLDLSDPHLLGQLVRSIIYHEQGRCIYSNDTIFKASKDAIYVLGENADKPRKN